MDSQVVRISLNPANCRSGGRPYSRSLGHHGIAREYPRRFRKLPNLTQIAIRENEMKSGPMPICRHWRFALKNVTRRSYTRQRDWKQAIATQGVIRG